MVDIATVSVVSSGLVALGTLGANFIGGERQRRHDADLNFEMRVWERKSEALFTVIERCRLVTDSDIPLTDGNRKFHALYLSKMLDALNGTRSTVEAFASSRCREELAGLIEALRTAGVKRYVGNRVDRFHQQRLDADPEDLSTRKRCQDLVRAAEEKAVADFDPDLRDLRARAERLLEAARESVRRPKD